MPIFTTEMIKDHALYKEGKEDGIEQEKQKAKKKEQLLKEKAEKKEQLLKEKAEKKEQLLKEKAEKKEQLLKEKTELLKEKAEKKEQLLKEKAEKKEIQAIINLHKDRVDIKIIAKALNTSQKRVKQVIEDLEKQ